jgi:hypothetical protein
VFKKGDLKQVFDALEPGLADKSNIEEMIKEATLEGWILIF